MTPYLMLVVFIVVQLHGVTTQVPSGYSTVPDVGVVKASSSAKSLREATADCASDGAHVMVINSEAKKAYVNRITDNTAFYQNAYNPRDVWVGIEVQGGAWVTVTGLPLSNVPTFSWCDTRPVEGGCAVFAKPYQCHWDMTSACADAGFRQPYFCEKPQDEC